MATVLRRRPAPRNSGNKIVIHTVTSQPTGEAQLKAGAVKGTDQSSSSGSSSSRQDGSHESSINSSSVSCVYEQKMCATCACPMSCCLCSTAFSTLKGVPWTGKRPGCKGDGSGSTGSGSESKIKAAGWGHNEPLFLAAAAALTALQALILALQRVNGRGWAEKALEAQANACMFWVQAAAHAVGQDDYFKPRFASGSSAFHDAEMLLALPDCEQGQEKRRKRSAPSSKVTEPQQQQGWQRSLSFSPSLSSSPSGSSGFSFVQEDDLDEPSALEPSVLESLVQTLIGTTPETGTGTGTGAEQAPPSPLDKPADTVWKPEISPPEKENLPSPPQASTTSSTTKSEQVEVVVITSSVKSAAASPALLPPVSKKVSETMTRKQKRNLKKKNKNSVPSSVTVTPRDRPASAK